MRTALALAVLCVASPVLAQAPGAANGPAQLRVTVLDQTSAGIPAAVVTVTVPGAAPVKVVADEHGVDRVDTELGKRAQEDRRVGLAEADLVGEDDDVEPLGETELAQLLAEEAPRLGPRVRDQAGLQSALAQRVEQRVRGAEEPPLA